MRNPHSIGKHACLEIAEAVFRSSQLDIGGIRSRVTQEILWPEEEDVDTRTACNQMRPWTQQLLDELPVGRKTQPRSRTQFRHAVFQRPGNRLAGECRGNAYLQLCARSS
jgi:hypothetical protein